MRNHPSFEVGFASEKEAESCHSKCLDFWDFKKSKCQ